MKGYVIQMKFLEEQPYYVKINDGEDSFSEIYCPNYATVFSSKKAATEWYKENSTFDEYMSVVELQDAIEKWADWVAGGTVRRVLPIVDKSFNVPYDKDKHTPLDVLKFNFHIAENESTVKQEIYNSWPTSYMTELGVFKFIYDVKSYYSSCHTELYHTIEVAVKRHVRDFATFKKELELALPFCTYRDTIGRYVIHVNNPNWRTTVELFVGTDLKTAKVEAGYGEFAGTLEECYEHVRENYPSDSGDDEDDDDGEAY